MAEAVAVPTAGFAVPPAAPGTTQHSRISGAAPAPRPAPVAPVVPTGTTTEQVPTAGQRPQLPSANPEEVSETTNEVQAYLKSAIEQAKNATTEKPIDTSPPEHTPTTLRDIDVAQIESPQVRELGKLLLTALPGADIDVVFGKAFEYGDPALINAEYIKARGGDSSAQLIEMAKQIVRTATAEIEASVNSVYRAAGGEDQWQAAVAAFNKNAPKHLKTVAVKLLDSPNRTEIQEGAKFVIEFARQGGFVTEPGERVNAQGGANLGERGLSAADYKEAIRSLKPSYSNPNRNAEEAELYRLRVLGKSRGL